MLCIKNPYTDPCFNLAAEEYMLKNFREDCFMLWRNEPSVIVGKHQNTLSEINIDFIREKKIRVVRRISGGGAVYHDLGNLNYTFIVTGHKENLVNFRKFTQPVIEVLEKKDLKVKFENRNDITIDGRKISGNAEHIWKDRTLHHGTLLFSAELSDLSSALNSGTGKFNDKAVKSIRSGVTNIKEHLKQNMDILEFRDLIMDHVMSQVKDSKLYFYTAEDIAGIQKLRNQKYIQWEWNFGYSPHYYFRNEIHTAAGKLEFQIDVEKGYIRNIKISGDLFCKNDSEMIEQSLIGIKHDKETMIRILSGSQFDDYFRNIDHTEFIAGLF